VNAEQRFNKIEQRLDSLEHTYDDIIKNEEMIIKLSQCQTFNIQELSARTGNLQLDIGDLRERFDGIGRKIDKIEAAQEQHGDKLDRHTEILEQILQLLQPK
jgi:tetrahydromethanopterin S-methyltransferase subunit G